MFKNLKFTKDNIPQALIAILVLCLFYSVYKNLDGLGVFAIVSAIIFLFIAMYGCSSNHVGGESNSPKEMMKKLVAYFKRLDPITILRLLISTLRAISAKEIVFSEQETRLLIQELEGTLNALKEQNKYDGDDSSSYNTSSHKKKPFTR